MSRKYAVMLIIVGTMLMGSLFLGSSYAIYQITKVQPSGRVNEVIFGCFDMTSETQVNPLTNNDYKINMTNTYPMSDTKGLEQEPYVVKITNNCTTNAYPTKTRIYLDTFKTNTLTPANIRVAYQINDNPIVEAKNLNTFTEEIMVNDEDVDKGYLLTNVKVKNGSPVTFKVWVWVDEDEENDVQNKEFKSIVRIVTDAYFKEEADDIMTTQGKSVQEAIDDIASKLN